MDPRYVEDPFEDEPDFTHRRPKWQIPATDFQKRVLAAVNQIEAHPFFQRHSDQELMKAHGVQMESWGGFAEGRNNLFSDPTLGAIAEAHGKSIAQVVLRWLIQRDIVAVSKSVRRDRMEQNLDVFDFTLTAEEMTQIATMETGVSLFFDHRDPDKVAWLNSRRDQ